MFNPIDVLDKELYFRTPVFNKSLKQYVETWGKKCIFYINPDHEGKENDIYEDLEQSTDILNNDESKKRTDNYSLAYGKDSVGYDYSKLQKVNAHLLGNRGYEDWYVHDIGAVETIDTYLHVIGTPVSRGDIISITIQDKEAFYRITEKVMSMAECVYKINCKLIETKKLSGGYRPYDIHKHLPDLQIQSDYGVVL